MNFGGLLLSQEPNHQIYNYTVNEGLPSNECHDVLQDALGYIWVATDRGLVKWDGYDFKVYGLSKGLKDMSCLNLYLDSRNNIWTSTINSGLFIYQSDLDTIIEYEHNKLLLDANGRIPFFGEITVFENGDLIVNLHEIGPVLITKSGNLEYLTEDKDKRYINIQQFNDELMLSRTVDHNHELETSQNEFLNLNGKLTKTCHHTLNNNVQFYNRAYSTGRDSIVFVYRGVKYFFINGQLERCSSTNASLNDLIVTSKHELFTCGIDFEGVSYYTSVDDWLSASGKNLLPDISATGMLLDRDNNIWVVSLTQGLFYLEESEVFKVHSNSITSLDLFDSTLVTLENNRTIKKYSPAFQAKVVKNYKSKKRSITAHSDKGIVILTGSQTSILKLNEIDNGNKDSEVIISYVSSNSAQILNDGMFMIGGRATIQKFGNQYKEVEYLRYENFPKIGRVTDVYSSSDGKLYVGSSTGLYEYNDSEWEKIEYDNFVKGNLRINDILEVTNGMALATIGEGLVILKNDGLSDNINRRHGLVSDKIEKVISLSMSEIVAISKSGFSILEIQESGHYKVVKNYDVRQGLPSNEVTDIKLKGDTIIVGTLGGLAYIKKAPRDVPVVRPFIERVEVNGLTLLPSDARSLEYEQNNIKISFKALDYQQHGILRYRYKINDEKWFESVNTSVDYASLEPGQYDFLVQVQNIDGLWGDEASLSFEVLKPWWNTLWFYALSMLSLFSFGYWLNGNRIKRIVQTAKMKEDLRMLEMSALRAQMNPHFIFNCLNSIQSFIMTNDKERAMDYLSKFAKLVRQTLNASINSTITLEQEISMLKNYLSLEKLRHKDRFNFKIEIDNNFDVLAVRIPPLLIQPYVENAVIHGMKGIREGGEIRINFYNDSSDFIYVNIEDNGIGVSHKKENKPYESVGMNITSQRLKLLNRQESKSMAVRDKYSKNGSKIEIKIRKAQKNNLIDSSSTIS